MSSANDDPVIRLLEQYNPWWRDPSAIRDMAKPRRRLACHEALKILQHKTLKRSVVLSGARQTGKTTILYQLIEHLIGEGIRPCNILYISFDDPAIRRAGAESVLAAFGRICSGGGTRYLFLDDIQCTGNWKESLLTARGGYEDMRLVAAGSSLSGADHDVTGREAETWRVLNIPPLSFYEYCSLLNLAGPPLPRDLSLTGLSDLGAVELRSMAEPFLPLKDHFDRYLTAGGFPKTALSDDSADMQRMLREEVIDKVIRNDMPELFGIRNPGLMERLLRYFCANSAGHFNAAATAKELGHTSVSTVESYMEMLETAGLICLSRPVKVGSKGALRGKPKVYAADESIRCAVLAEDGSLLENGSGDRTEKTVEAAVYRHLVSFYQASPAHLGYYRKAKESQKKVDIVVNLPCEKILCEIGYRSGSGLAASDAIAELCRDKTAGVSGAFLVTKELEDFGNAGAETAVPILRIPAAMFLYLIGKAEAEGQNGKL